MTKILSLYHIDIKEPTVCTIGNFDGVHIGHKALINKVKEDSLKFNTKSLIITFFPHPRKVLSPQNYKCSIVNFETKIYLLKKEDVDYILIVDFNERFYKKSPAEFMNFLKEKLNCRKIVVGKDWRFGYKKEGDIEFAKEYGKQIGIEVEDFGIISLNQEKISSSKIRELLLAGNVKEAKKYLGRDYFLREKVVKGDGVGKKLGFPTINLKPDDDLCLKMGVYTGFLEFEDKKYPVVINYGNRPTVDGKKIFMEAHVIENFEIEMRENSIVNIYFIDRLRDEKRFESVEELKKQIMADIEKAREVLGYVY
ncbi:MAG: bifunctional riboflavin kinase/FAD synthetase [Hydrogenothermaceae bacterium]|nr:bifunctional riboflavin kinase/FAD synthetase [Hydrogenothermaceae bacterium]